MCRKVEFSTMPLELAREIDQNYQTYLTPYKANVAVVNGKYFNIVENDAIFGMSASCYE